MAEDEVKELLARLYPPRGETGHKGTYGYVLVVGGSGWYTGALVFNAVAALRAGADLCYCFAPERAADAAAHHLPDVIGIPFPGEVLGPDALHTYRRLLERVDAVVIGGGLDDGDLSKDGIAMVIRETEKPMVLDATALHVVGERPELLEGKTALLTPHPGEFERLTGEDVRAPDLEARAVAAERAARRFGASLLLKGFEAVVSDGARTVRHRSGSPYLTKGGYGDVMAGVAGALVARGASPFEAGLAATHLVGAAGALAAGEKGEGTLASEAVERLPDVLRRALGRP